MTIGFLSLGIVQILAAYAVVCTLGALVLLASWPWLVRGTQLDPLHHARTLFAARLMPAASATVMALGVAVSYLLWEPRHGGERVGAAALTLAVVGGAFILTGIVRACLALGQSRSIARQLIAVTRDGLTGVPIPAVRIDAGFPIVALVGLVRPRLYVASGVMDVCTGEELQTVIAHELAHAGAHDNLRRLMIAVAADPIAWSRFARPMLNDWAAAAELAADETAVGSQRARRLHLAAALIKVARLATGTPPAIPAAALYRGGSIEDRVHRLAGESAVNRPSPRARWWTIAAVMTLIAFSPMTLRALRTAVEVLIAYGRL